MTKPLRKTVALDLKSFEKLEVLCASARRGKGNQLAVLIDEAHKRLISQQTREE